MVQKPMSGWTTHVTDNVVQLNFLNIIISTELQEIGKELRAVNTRSEKFHLQD